jgi:uncharacterized cofD-like protein
LGRTQPALEVVALGGGHGLHASLRALRQVVDAPTAIVTVADNGGSSGQLREEFDVLPPGDLRMALAALCAGDEWGRTWEQVVQHRLSGRGSLGGHPIGNLLYLGLWELMDDPVLTLDWLGRLLQVQGRVLPMALTPMDITAEVDLEGRIEKVRGQVAVATTPGRIRSVTLDPLDPKPCPEALDAVGAADWIVLGPGSWFTSVIPHLLVPSLRRALVESPARVLVTLNLDAQPGETSGFDAEDHLAVLVEHAPDLGIDVVLADEGAAEPSLAQAVADLGALLHVAPVADPGGAGRHDPARLAAAYDDIFGG